MNLKDMQETLAIFGKYCDISKEYLEADHDEIFFPAIKGVTQEDLVKLKRLGVYQEDAYDEDEPWKTFT